MTGELVVQGSFQERMMERIKGSIGELMTDDELKKIVSRGVDEAFFKQTIIKRDYGREDVIEPWLFPFLRKLLEDRMKEFIDAHLESRKEEIVVKVNEFIQKGAGEALVKAFSDKFSQSFYTFGEELKHGMSSH